MKRWLKLSVGILVGLLAVSAGLLALGSNERKTDPRIDSFRPSGLAAFAELLRANGYAVRLGPAPASSGALTVVPVKEQKAGTYEVSDAVAGFLGSRLRGGGRMLIAPLPEDFMDAVDQASAHRVENAVTGAALQVRSRTDLESNPDWSFADESDVQATIWADGSAPFAWLFTVGRGRAALVSDGLVATNQFIGEAQNADLLMNMIATMTTGGPRIVYFDERTFSGEEPSLLEILGPGATAAWNQALFLFLIVVLTLGKRFGLPDETRSSQVGQRELVDAIADVFRRGRQTRVACQVAHDRADLAVRTALRLPESASQADRDAALPPDLALKFRAVFEGSVDRLAEREAFRRCLALHEAVNQFTAGAARKRERRPHPRRTR